MYTYSIHLFFALAVIFSVTGCKEELNKLPSSSIVQFPDDWLGYWEGELKIYNDTGMTMSILMGLDLDTIAIDSGLQWNLIYDLKGDRDERKYFLKPHDTQKGHWVTDEDNSILLDGFVLDNGYYTIFEIGNNRIETSYVLTEGQLLFENRVTKTDTIRISGGAILDNQEIPEVRSYRMSGIQKARLKKKKKY